MTDKTSHQLQDEKVRNELFKVKIVKILMCLQIFFALIGIVVIGFLMFYYRPNLQEAYMDIVNLRSSQTLGILRSIISSRILDIILYLIIILQVIIMIENRGRYWIYPLLATLLSLIYLVPNIIMIFSKEH